jgi:hypothetical protein
VHTSLGLYPATTPPHSHAVPHRSHLRRRRRRRRRRRHRRRGRLNTAPPRSCGRRGLAPTHALLLPRSLPASLVLGPERPPTGCWHTSPTRQLPPRASIPSSTHEEMARRGRNVGVCMRRASSVERLTRLKSPDFRSCSGSSICHFQGQHQAKSTFGYGDGGTGVRRGHVPVRDPQSDPGAIW